MKIYNRIAAVILAMGTTVASEIALSAPTSATVWDPHVRLIGHASCGIYPVKMTGLWLWTAQDGGSWQSFSGRNYSESYSRDFWHVPAGNGTTVSYDLYCGGTKMMHGTFGLARPTFGATATRDLWARI